MAEKVKANASPWADGWRRPTANRHSAAGWSPRPVETVIRGGGDYGADSGGFDELGFGTLAYVLEP